MTPYRLFDPKDPRYVKYIEIRDKLEEARKIVDYAKRYRSLKRNRYLRSRRKGTSVRIAGTPRSSIADTFNMISLYFGLPYRFADNPLNRFYPYYKVDYSDTRKRTAHDISKIYDVSDQAITARIRKWRPLFNSFIKEEGGWSAVKYDRKEFYKQTKSYPPRYKMSILDRSKK